MNPLLQDLRYSLRLLAKRPGFTLVAVITLALGIGANTAIFSVVNAVLLRPLNYNEPDQIVALWENVPTKGGRWRVAPANFFDWKNQNQVFAEMAAFSSSGFNLTGTGEPEQIRGARASQGYFSVLGVEPILGRAFLPEEYEPGKGQVVILDYGFWQRRFGSDSKLIGQTLTLDDKPYTVVGVMPAGIYPTWPMTAAGISFEPQQQQYWVPMSFTADWAANRYSHVLGVVARLKPGVTTGRAQTEMDVIAQRLEQDYPANNRDEGIIISPFINEVVGNVRPALFVLLGAVGCVLLIACANIASLLLAQLAARRKEIAIRAALGARRAHLVRQFLVEGLMLSLLGGACGVLLATWGIDLLLRMIPQNIPRLNQVGVDLKVLSFTLLLSLAASLIFGFAPALQASKTDLQEALKEAGRSSGANPSRQRFRRLLVVAQIGMAVVLVIGAGLLIKSFWRLRQVDPGFNPAHVVVMNLTIPPSRYREWHQISGFYTQLHERLQNLPGVRSATIAYDQPLASNWINSFLIEGQPAPAPGQTPVENFRPVGHDYFRTLGIELLKGRHFTAQDDPGHTGAAIINDAFARQYFPNEDPLGHRLQTDTPALMANGPMPTSFEIVGVVRDTKFNGLSAVAAPAFYIPARQFPLADMIVLARVEGDPLNYTQTLRDTVWAIDPDQPVNSIAALEHIVADDIAQPRFNMFLMGLFSALAVMLAAVGIYGLLSYAVTQRTQEIGVRMALGAQRRDIFKLIVGQGLRLTLAGVGIGLAAALLLTRFLSSLLYGLSATDFTTFAFVALLLAAVALIACYLPARRATKVDPMEALRYE
ncbi:MAG: hypothetical protein V7641_2824 [Blastocatellia bacterium]